MRNSATNSARNIPNYANKLLDLAGLTPLPAQFYIPDPREIAPKLLGKILLRRKGRSLRTGRIVELEVYLGADDAAAHAAAGLTQRNSVLFGPPGRAYVYLTYGLHYCLNISCMPEGQAGSVLFRALEPLAGFSAMAKARGLASTTAKEPQTLRLLTSGPARLCQALEITREQDNNRDMTSPDSGLWIADDGYKVKKVVITPRIGITRSAELPLRYYIEGNPFVSGMKKIRNSGSV
jgi:DNA-3-methyladenine glycosylase